MTSNAENAAAQPRLPAFAAGTALPCSLPVLNSIAGDFLAAAGVFDGAPGRTTSKLGQRLQDALTPADKETLQTLWTTIENHLSHAGGFGRTDDYFLQRPTIAYAEKWAEVAMRIGAGAELVKTVALSKTYDGTAEDFRYMKAPSLGALVATARAENPALAKNPRSAQGPQPRGKNDGVFILGAATLCLGMIAAHFSDQAASPRPNTPEKPRLVQKFEGACRTLELNTARDGATLIIPDGCRAQTPAPL